jgi:hypothetical protein
MLLINENDIKPEIKEILTKVITQLTEISSVIKKNSLEQNEDLKKVNPFCENIINKENPFIFLETFFSNNKTWDKPDLEKLAPLLSLDTKDISALESEYSIKYPKKLNATKKDVELLNQALEFSLVEDIKTLPSLKSLNKAKSSNCHLNLVNYLLKTTNQNGDTFNNFIKKLQSKVLNNPKITPEYFSKYFGIPPLNTNFADIEKVSGIAVFSSVLEKNKPERKILQMKDIGELEQISIKNAIDMGVTFNLDTAKNYHFFRSGDFVYPLHKDNPIIDAKMNDLVKKPIVGKKGYSNIEADLNIRVDQLPKVSGNPVLDYKALKKIRTAILLQRPKWSVGSVLKQDNCYFYVASPLVAQPNGDFHLEAVVINPVYETEYFIRSDIKIDKSNCKEFSLADKIDSLLVFEAINSAFQYAETRNSSNELYQTMSKRMGY